MLFAEKESNIIKSFQNVDLGDIVLLPETDDVEAIFNSIFEKEKWALWTDSSGKDAPPPDFFCDELGLMMEVMRVDDHGFKKKGNIINPTLDREHQIEKELREKGILDAFPNATLHINAVTGLPTREDHNYDFYLANFKRTVEKHKTKIVNYKQNHPGFKVLFFVFDESSMYCKVDQPNMTITKNATFKCEPHWWFWDEEFVSVFENSEIDCLIWFTPYKRVVTDPPLHLPRVCVFDCKKVVAEKKKYNPIFMMSSEE